MTTQTKVTPKKRKLLAILLPLAVVLPLLVVSYFIGPAALWLWLGVGLGMLFVSWQMKRQPEQAPPQQEPPQ